MHAVYTVNSTENTVAWACHIRIWPTLGMVGGCTHARRGLGSTALPPLHASPSFLWSGAVAACGAGGACRARAPCRAAHRPCAVMHTGRVLRCMLCCTTAMCCAACCALQGPLAALRAMLRKGRMRRCVTAVCCAACCAAQRPCTVLCCAAEGLHAALRKGCVLCCTCAVCCATVGVGMCM